VRVAVLTVWWCVRSVGRRGQEREKKNHHEKLRFFFRFSWSDI
jgi:hypothetical protein